MRILAIDTSGPGARWCGVTEDGPFAPREETRGRRHDAVLGEGIASWLDERGWRGERAPNAVAVVTGPGGFTGLRVGVAFATGLGAALGVRVVPVPSAAVLAASVQDGMVWAILRAEGHRVRSQLWRGGSNPEPSGEIFEFDPGREVPLPDGAELGMAEGQKVVPLGEGYARHRARIDEVLGNLRREVELRPWPEALADAVRRVWKDGLAASPLEIDVDYGSEFKPTRKQ